MKKLIYTSLPLTLLPALSWAHGGHAHAAAGSPEGILHAFTTHPMLFAAVGLLLVGYLLYKRP